MAESACPARSRDRDLPGEARPADPRRGDGGDPRADRQGRHERARVPLVDDVRAMYESLRSRGVTDFTQEPTDHFYGTDMGVRDPFGNAIRILQPAKFAQRRRPDQYGSSKRQETRHARYQEAIRGIHGRRTSGDEGARQGAQGGRPSGGR